MNNSDREKIKTNFLTAKSRSVSQETGKDHQQIPVSRDGFDEDAVEKKAKSEWNQSTDIRDEFVTFSIYSAYCKALASGKIKI